MKKLMQKLGSLILVAAMVLSLAVPVMADEQTELAVPPTVTEMEWSNINAYQPQGAGVKGWNYWADHSRAYAPYCNSITSTQVNGDDAEIASNTFNLGIIIGADYLTIGRNYAVFTAEGYENMMLVFDYAVDADGNKTVTFVEQKFGAEAYYVPAVVRPTIFFTGDQEGETSRFLTSATVEITESTEGAEVYYTTDGTVPTKDSTLYTGPFTVTEGCTIQAKAFLGDDESTVAKFTCSVIPNSELPGSYTAEAALSSLNFQADQNNSDIAAVIEDTADATVIKNEDGSYTYEVTLTASEGTATGSFASYHGNGVITGQDLQYMQYRPASNNWNEPEAEIVYDNPLAGIRKFKATFSEIPRGLLLKFKLHDYDQMPTGNLWLKPDSFTAEAGEADPAELEKTIAGAKKADLAYLEEETVSAWNQAIAQAEEVLDDMEAAQADMDAAVANILSIYADITAQKGEGYALVNIPYDAFYRAEVGENGVDTVSGATVAKSRNYALAAGSWHAAEGKAAEGATYAVKVSDLAQLKAAAKAKGGAEITDASALSYEVSGKNGTSTTELKGAEVLFESPAYSYYLLAEEPAAYKELTITEEAFAFGEATAAAAGEAEVALDLSDRHADYTLKVTTNDFDDKDVSAAVITAGDKKYGLCAISNIWRKTELGWNSTGDYADIAGKTITNITYYTVKGNYSYDVEIAVPPYCDAVTAEFTGSRELTLKGIPADAENVKVTAYTDLKKKTGSLTGQEAAAVGTDGVAELSEAPEEDTEYVLTVTADNYKFAYIYQRSPKVPAAVLIAQDGTVTEQEDLVTAAAALQQDETLKLMKNAEVAMNKVQISAGTLDLNGFSITGTTNANPLIQVTGDHVTITSSSKQPGSLIVPDVVKRSAYAINGIYSADVSNITVDSVKNGISLCGGKISNVTVKSVGTGITKSSTGKMQIENCNVESSGGNAVSVANGSASINGGSYVSTGKYSALNNSSTMSVRVYDGVFVAEAYDFAVENTGNLRLSGGYYKAASAPVKGNYSATGGQKMTVKPLSEGEFSGYWSIVDGDYEEDLDESDYVASVDNTPAGTSYVSVAAAFAAMEKGDTLTLLADASLNSSVTFAGGYIDLNGHALTLNVADAVKIAGDTYLTDGKGGGKITSKYANMFVVENARLYNVSATIEETGNVMTQILVKDNGSFVMQGGSVLYTGQSGAGKAVSTNQGSTDCNVTVSGGMIDGGNGYAVYLNNIPNGGSASARWSGGTIKSNSAAIFLGDGWSAYLGKATVSAATGMQISGTNHRDLWFQGSTVEGSQVAVASPSQIYINPKNTYFKGEINAKYVFEASSTWPEKNGYQLARVTQEDDPYYGYVHAVKVTEENPAEYFLETYDAQGNLTGAYGEFDLPFILGGTTGATEVEEGTTFKLVKDLTAVPFNLKGLNVIVDLNGHKYTGQDDQMALFYMDGSGKITDSVGTGSVEGAACGMFYGNWTIEGGEWNTHSSFGNFVCGNSTINDADPTLTVTGGTFRLGEGGAIPHMMQGSWFKGDIILSGGSWSANPAAYVPEGYHAELNEETKLYDIVEGAAEAEEIRLGYEVPAEDTALAADVILHEDGTAYLAISMPNKAGANYVISADSVSVGDVTGAAAVTTELDGVEVVDYVELPLADVSGKSEVTVKAQAKEAADGSAKEVVYNAALDWSAYEGPSGSFKTKQITFHASGTAMSDYAYDEEATMIRYENGYDFLVFDFESWAQNFASSFVYIPVFDKVQTADTTVTSFPLTTVYNTDKLTNAVGYKGVIFEINEDEAYAISETVWVAAMGFSVGHVINLTTTWPEDTLEESLSDAEAAVADSENYTADSLKALEAAIAEAKAVSEKEDATEEERAEAKEALEKVYGGLVSLKELNGQIEEAEAFSADDFAADSFALLAPAIAEAREAAAKADASAEDIAKAEAALQAVIDSLVDVSGLKDEITQAQAISKKGYTADSFAALKDAIEKANEAAAKADATKESVKEAADALQAAIKGLTKKSSGTFVAGEYEIAQSLRKATNTASNSMAAPVFGDTAKVVVDEAGTTTVTLTFRTEAEIMNITCHPVGIDIYDAAGEKVAVTYETTTVSNLYNKETASNDTEGEALVTATFVLPYIADDGMYQGKIYSDYMDSEVAVWLDLDGVKKNVEEAIADGVYTVPVTIYKYTNPEDTSMANEALDGDVIVRVKDGAATYDMTYKGVVVGAYRGHLTNLFAYGAEDSAFENPLEAVVTETFEDTGLNGENGTFARTFALAGGKAGLDTIYIRVRVDAMEQIAKDNNEDYVLGDGEQIAIMTIDWDDAEAWTEKDAAAYEEKMAAAEATAAVNQAIEEANAIDTDNYTEDSVAALNKAIEEAKALGSDATEAQKNAAAKAIAEAIAQLTPYSDASVIASRSSLAAIVAVVNSMTSTGYTEDSFAALQNAVKAAEEVLANDTASVKSMKAASTDVNAALKALIRTISEVKLSKSSFVWNGKARQPEVTVTDAFGVTLDADTDYTVEYSKNKAVGLAEVTVTAKGAYEGTVVKTFTIKPAKAVIKNIKIKKGKKLTVNLKKAAKKYGASKFQIRYRVKGTSKWKKITVKKTATLKKLKAGKAYQIQVRAMKKVNGKTYYGAWSKVKTTKKIKK